MFFIGKQETANVFLKIFTNAKILQSYDLDTFFQ